MRTFLATVFELNRSIEDGFCKVRKPVEKCLLFHASKLVSVPNVFFLQEPEFSG